MQGESNSCNFSTVISQNNRAVELFLTGHLSAANAGFRECFILVKQCLTRAEEHHRESSDEKSSASPAGDRRPIHDLRLRAPALRLEATRPMGGMQNLVQRNRGDFFIYNRPILVYYKNGAPDYDNVGTGQLLSATLIFNMALLFHTKVQGSTPHDKNAQNLMVKAQKLYLSVVQIALSRDEDDSVLGITTVELTNFEVKQRRRQQREYASKWKLELGLAALNNYSQLCHELGELEMAERAAAALHSSVSELSQQRYAFSTSEWDQILLNILFLTLTKNQPGGVHIPCAPAA